MAKKTDEVIKFNERLKELVASQDDFVENYAQSLMAADGKAHIAVDLCHGSLLFDPYSGGKELAPSLYEYVENVAKYLRVSVPLAIDFYVPADQAGLESAIQKEFRGNYRFTFDEKLHEIKKCDLHIMWMFVVGILLIFLTMALTFFYRKYSTSNNDLAIWFDVMSQLTSIASWVFVWDGVDQMAFSRKELRHASLRAAQLAGADVHFVDGTSAQSAKENL
jgi:uncharacterized membrane protein